MALAAQGKIRHAVTPIRLEQVNETIASLRAGDVVGRAVIRY